MNNLHFGMHIVMKSDNNENNIYYIGYKNKIIKVLNFIFNPVVGTSFCGNIYEAWWCENHGNVYA